MTADLNRLREAWKEARADAAFIECEYQSYQVLVKCDDAIVAALEQALAKAETFIEILKAMVESAEAGEDYDTAALADIAARYAAQEERP